MKHLLVVVSVVLVLCLVSGCRDEASMAELRAHRAQAEIEKQNASLFRHLTEELNKKNAQVYRELCAPYFRYYPPHSKPYAPLSIEETMEHAQAVFEAFPDGVRRIEDLTVAGHRVFARVVFEGTQQGEYQEIPAAGHRVSLDQTVTMHAEEGKITDIWEAYDRLELLEQLGMAFRVEGMPSRKHQLAVEDRGVLGGFGFNLYTGQIHVYVPERPEEVIKTDGALLAFGDTDVFLTLDDRKLRFDARHGGDREATEKPVIVSAEYKAGQQLRFNLSNGSHEIYGRSFISVTPFDKLVVVCEYRGSSTPVWEKVYRR